MGSEKWKNVPIGTYLGIKNGSHSEQLEVTLKLGRHFRGRQVEPVRTRRGFLGLNSKLAAVQNEPDKNGSVCIFSA
jgi:hypothetical protein